MLIGGTSSGIAIAMSKVMADENALSSPSVRVRLA
jgi:hypothetical protein